MIMMMIYGVLNIKIKDILTPSLTRGGHDNKITTQRRKKCTDNNEIIITRYNLDNKTTLKIKRENNGEYRDNKLDDL